ncbi:MAG: response regulator [Deltaproteobacteria bacterium]|nr:response regulator [Deltaproteobacteria bacterium]
MEPKPILVVDDSMNILVTVAKALEILGHPVEVTAYAEEALQRLSRTEYALVLLDLELWGISGLEMLRRLRGRGMETPVIIITAYANPENEAEARDLGAIDFIPKPFTPYELRERVARVLERSV